ncbi:MAG: glycosyltransferase family 2 protein [Oscillospiraceae bacterium]|nr:glycosyltransferase family 2 protein [Oscillospiraceae bacterium]
MSTLLSFVIPCYRSELTIEMVVNEIIETVSQRDGYDYEIICVNDFSPDGVYSVLERLAAENKRIKVVDFARNMGKHAAVLAGYARASGDYIVNLDDDFQCPVYELWRLLEPLEKDECDFATANYNRKKQSGFKNFGSTINLMMASVMLEKPMSLRFENFSIMRRFVVEEIVKYDKPYPYLEGLVYRVTRRISVVMMEERERGDNKKTGFTFGKSLSLWLNGFTAFSVKPLRISSFLGAFISVFGFIVGAVMVIRKLIYPEVQAGYTSLIAAVLFIGGLVLMVLGLIGEYVGRIYICLNNTPQYVVKRTINLEEKSNSSLIGN